MLLSVVDTPRSVILLKDIAGSQIRSHGNTSYNRSWRLEVLGQVPPRALPLPIFEYTLICLRLGSSMSATERGDESGVVRRPRRGLYSPSLDISRETTPSSAPDDSTVYPLEALPLYLVLVPTGMPMVIFIYPGLAKMPSLTVVVAPKTLILQIINRMLDEKVEHWCILRRKLVETRDWNQ